MPRRFRILHLITDLDPGGAEWALCTVVEGLHARGHRVEVASLLPPGRVADTLTAAGVPVDSVGAQGAADPGLLARLAGLLSRRRPDILHTHMFHAGFLGRLLAPVLGIRRLVHTVQVCEREKHIHLAAERLVSTFLDMSGPTRSHVVCVSEAVARFVGLRAGVRPQQRSVIPNVPRPASPIRPRDEVRPELGVSPGQTLLLSLGRLHAQKDFPTLLRAFAQVRAEAPGALLAIAGKGPAEGDLVETASRLGIRQDVRFLGWRPDTTDLLHACDVFVLSSLWEGMPVAVLEAMRAGRPVVATAVDGTPEAVDHERTGLLVPPRSPSLLAAAILRLVRDPLEARSFGRAGRERVLRDFTPDRCVDLHEQVYREMAP